MLRTLLKIQRTKGDIGAASRGPKPLVKRLARRAPHRMLAKIIG